MLIIPLSFCFPTAGKSFAGQCRLCQTGKVTSATFMDCKALSYSVVWGVSIVQIQELREEICTGPRGGAFRYMYMDCLRCPCWIMQRPPWWTTHYCLIHCCLNYCCCHCVSGWLGLLRVITNYTIVIYSYVLHRGSSSIAALFLASQPYAKFAQVYMMLNTGMHIWYESQSGCTCGHRQIWSSKL